MKLTQNKLSVILATIVAGVSILANCMTANAAGAVPTVVTTINGAGDEKIVATFTFISKSKLLDTAGWREKEVIKNAKYFHIERIDGADMIYFYTESDGDTAEGIFDTKRSIWRG